MISVIVPVLNEASRIADTLQDLRSLLDAGHEVIVVDGGSRDATVDCVMSLKFPITLVNGNAGRATQMNLGASKAKGDLLWFLHADTRVPPAALDSLMEQDRPDVWGRFDVRLSGDHLLLRVVEWSMNWRSRLTAIATGDQGIFVGRDLFEAVGGFPSLPLMEDICLSKHLKAHCRPVCLTERLKTSSRRWEQHGMLRTIGLMWYLRLAFWLGVSPEVLHRRYYRS